MDININVIEPWKIVVIKVANDRDWNAQTLFLNLFCDRREKVIVLGKSPRLTNFTQDWHKAT